MGMWKAYKQSWKDNIKSEAGDRSGVRVFLFYAAIVFGNFGILFAGFLTLILAAWLSVAIQILSIQQAGDIAGFLLVCCLYLMFAFCLSESGNKFSALLGDKIEQSLIDSWRAFRVLPIMFSLSNSVFFIIDEVDRNFVSAPPFTPPRQHLA